MMPLGTAWSQESTGGQLFAVVAESSAYEYPILAIAETLESWYGPVLPTPRYTPPVNLGTALLSRLKMFIKTVLYASRAQSHRASRQLSLIVPLARVANQRAKLTSILNFDGLNYLQLIEGAEREVDALMARIAMDQRHSQVRVLFEETGLERSYIGFPLTQLSDGCSQQLVSALVEGKQKMRGDLAKRLLPVFWGIEAMALPA